MSVTLSDRRAGMLFGSLVADSLALGAHWIYDQAELRRDFGRVTELLDPRPDSYHPGKKRGQQTHYGDQVLSLMASLEVSGEFKPEAFARDWAAMWDGYGDYFDHATKDTLANLKSGHAPTEAGSHSVELGGTARIAPLLALMANGPVEAAVAAARAQTVITHHSPITGDAAEFLTRIVFALLTGAELHEAMSAAEGGAYESLSVAGLRAQVAAVHSLDTAAAAEALGLACPAPKALPTLLMLLERHGADFETAVIENVMAGGDNAARGVALGMILGAAHGGQAIPARWRQGLEAGPRVEAYLEGLDGASEAS